MRERLTDQFVRIVNGGQGRYRIFPFLPDLAGVWPSAP